MDAILPAMQLSDRVSRLKASSTLAVNARARAIAELGVDVVGFGAGEPDFDTPQSIKQAAIDALLAGQTKYQPTPGPLDVREAIAEKLRSDNSIDASPENVVITVGGKHAGYLAMQCLLDPGKGQEVILPTPAWVSYRPFVELAGGTVVEVPGEVENDFKVTPEQLHDAISDRTAAVIFNSPSNPCGTMYSPAELEAIAEILAGHEQITIISDEIYERLIYPEIDPAAEHKSLGAIDLIADRVVTLNGLSKAYAMTGWRTGYLHAPPEVAKAAAKLQSQMTSNITAFCYPAIIEALTNCDEEVERMRRAFASRAKLIHQLVGEMPNVVCPQPTGAFYVFPDISAHLGKESPEGSKIVSALSFAEALLSEANVAVVPGEDFGECANTNIRLSFALNEARIQEGCRRIHDWLQSLTQAQA